MDVFILVTRHIYCPHCDREQMLLATVPITSPLWKCKSCRKNLALDAHAIACTWGHAFIVWSLVLSIPMGIYSGMDNGSLFGLAFSLALFILGFGIFAYLIGFFIGYPVAKSMIVPKLDSDERIRPTQGHLPRERRVVVLSAAGGVMLLLLVVLCVLRPPRFGVPLYPIETPDQIAQRRDKQKNDKNKANEVVASDLFANGNAPYLADLKPMEVKNGPWRVANDGSVGNPFRWPIEVNKVKSPKGIGMHPPENGYACAKYRLDGRAKKLETKVALNDTATDMKNPVRFVVLGDGKELWQSPPIDKTGVAVPCDVDLTGVDLLELQTHALGSHWGLHAVWIEPKLLP